MKNKETRAISNPIEIRKLEDGREVISGYAIVFNRDSGNLGGFIEQIDSRALDNTDMTDVVALFNHDTNFILGRSPKTLTMSIDERGLRYDIDPPETQAAKDLMVSINRGDVRGSSFGFSISDGGDEWIEPTEKGEVWRRTITGISKLWDVSPVVTPAYNDTDTEVAKRNLGLKKDEKEKTESDALETEKQKRQLEINIQNQNLELFKLEFKTEE